MHAVGAEHVRQLVRVEDDRRRSERQHEARELVGQELGRLEMHVRVEEAGNDVVAGRIDDLLAVVVAETCDPAVGDRDVGVEPFACEHREHAAAAHDYVGRLVAAGDGEASGELGDGHGRGDSPMTAKYAWRVDVLTPRTLEEALRLKAELPAAVPIQGGTDLMVELNFDRSRPGALLNLNEVPELRGWSRDGDTVWLGAGLTYVEAMEPRLAEALPALAEAARTVGGPQIRNRGTIGGNLGTSSPAGDALPPLLVCGATVKLASVRGEREVRATRVRRRAQAERPRRRRADPRRLRRRDRKPADVHEGRPAQRDGDRGRVARGPRGRRAARRVRIGRAGADARAAELADADSFPQRVAEAASPIDDVRGSAVYRRHALRILTRRALDRCLV